jgi:hypothetical protein
MAIIIGGNEVTIDNITEDDIDQIFEFDNNLYFFSLAYGTDYRFSLIDSGIFNLDLFFETKYKNEYDTLVGTISTETKQTYESLGGSIAGLSTEAVVLGTNLSNWISTSLGAFTNINVGLDTSGDSLVNYLGRWGGDAVESFLYSQINFMNHITFNSNGGNTNINNIGISSTNPQTLVISDRIQQEWANEIIPIFIIESLEEKGTQTQSVVDDIFKQSINFVNGKNTVSAYSGNPWSLSWFLIQGQSIHTDAKSPYIDEETGDLVIQNKYNFVYTDNFEILNKFSQQIENILGSSSVTDALNWWNSTPFSFTSPHLLLESAGISMKIAKSQNIDPESNLDGLDYNYFEVRISKKNLEIGNYILYNTLLEKGWL